MKLSHVQKFSAAVNTVILLMVFGLMAFFHLCKVHFLTMFSIPTAMIYFIGYYLIYKEKLLAYVWMVYCWLTFYMGVTTVCLGYGYG
ncbi:MAG TPA: GGDEF domain-containing protein, partial [Ruminococcus flavefaciens]|nr:GGDEF domain-containing protein [Ruminococcus flavefaciens]